MTRAQIATIHSGYWTLYAGAVALVLLMLRSVQGGPIGAAWALAMVPVLLMAVGPNVLAFYVAYGPVFRRYLSDRRVLRTALVTVGVALSSAAAGILLAVLLFGTRQPALSDWRECLSLTTFLAAMAALHAAGGFIVRGFVAWWISRVPKAAPVVLAPEAEPVEMSRPFFFVKTEQRLERVRFDDIILIEGQRDYRRIHTSTRRIMTLQTFGELERQLPPGVMCRVHKSFMVALDKIDAVEKQRIKIGGIHGLVVPISDTYRQGFYDNILGQGHG